MVWLIVGVLLVGFVLVEVHMGFKEVHRKRRWRLRLQNARMAAELGLLYAEEEKEEVVREVEEELAKQYRGSRRFLEMARRDVGLPPNELLLSDLNPNRRVLGSPSPRRTNRRSHPATHA